MAEIKTKATPASAENFIESVENKRRREDAKVLLAMFSRITEQPPVMWGTSIIGYGTYVYQLADGSRNPFMRSGFSPRKQNLSIYVGAGMSEHPELLENLGKHKTSKACLYINKLADVDLNALEALIRADLAVMNQKYPE